MFRVRQAQPRLIKPCGGWSRRGDERAAAGRGRGLASHHPPSPLLLGRNLRRPLTRRPRVAAALSAEAEGGWKMRRRQTPARGTPARGRVSFLQGLRLRGEPSLPCLPERKLGGPPNPRFMGLRSCHLGVRWKSEMFLLVPSFPMRIRNFSSTPSPLSTSLCRLPLSPRPRGP